MIDGADNHLMPGLAHMHTHINAFMFENTFFNLFLANGVTTICDLARGSPPSFLHFRREIESSKRLGPSILVAYTIWGDEKGHRRSRDEPASPRVRLPQDQSDGHVEDALRVFRLNVEEYPGDWNVFDSYGEACMKAGMKELALDPAQENPRNMLRQLTQQ